MRTEKNILIAFLLNISFSIFEIFGGLYTGSVAIISDAIHDMGDGLSIGIAYLLEKKSKQKPDGTYTYGYGRFSVLGSIITTMILIFGSILVIYNAILRVLNPVPINHDGMIILSIIGIIINFAAAYYTREGDSINQKSVNLHMLEDVLGWFVVFIGAIIMRYTDISVIDPLMSIAVSSYILYKAVGNLFTAIDIFLEKAPHGMTSKDIFDKLITHPQVIDVHHIHLWTINSNTPVATMHVLAESVNEKLKYQILELLAELNINHVTIEFETRGDHCHSQDCQLEFNFDAHAHHHHH